MGSLYNFFEERALVIIIDAKKVLNCFMIIKLINISQFLKKLNVDATFDVPDERFSKPIKISEHSNAKNSLSANQSLLFFIGIKVKI